MSRSILPALILACCAGLSTPTDAATPKDKALDRLIAADLKTCAKPEWPAESLRRGEQGRVTLAYLIGLDGRVLESRVEESSGHPLLDMAAQDGLAKCLFASPETIGRREPTWTKMQYVWYLEEDEEDTPAQRKERLEQIRSKASAGDAKALFQLSNLLVRGDEGIAQDMDQALRLLRRSAELGYADAQSILAAVLMAGEKMERNPKQAIEWANKAAAQGAPHSQVALALLLLNAPEEFQDFDAAVEALEKAVAAGDVEAKSLLGLMLLEGEGAVQRRGLALIIDAAEAQDRLGQHELARIYEEGILLPKDVAKARALYARAAAAGHDPSREALARLTP